MSLSRSFHSRTLVTFVFSATKQHKASLSSSNSLSASITPSDSFSQAFRPSPLSADITTIHQPAKRPSQFPESILWLFEHACADPHVQAASSNKSRPSMRMAIRNTDGSRIEPGEWTAIMRSSRLVKADLLSLPTPRHLQGKDSPRTGIYFRRHFPSEWQAALDKLEQLQPLLSLCASHWKAEKVLTRVLQKAHESRGGKDSDADDEFLSEDTGTATSAKTSKKRQRSSSTTTASKRRKGKETANSSTDALDGEIISNDLSTGGFLSTPLSGPPATGAPTLSGINGIIEVGHIDVNPSRKSSQHPSFVSSLFKLLHICLVDNIQRKCYSK